MEWKEIRKGVGLRVVCGKEVGGKSDRGRGTGIGRGIRKEKGGRKIRMKRKEGGEGRWAEDDERGEEWRRGRWEKECKHKTKQYQNSFLKCMQTTSIGYLFIFSDIICVVWLDMNSFSRKFERPTFLLKFFVKDKDVLGCAHSL